MVAFNELTDEAKASAQKSFVTYYIRHFKQTDMEVLTGVASDSELAMINHVLEENNFLTVDALVDLSQSLVGGLFAKVLAKTGMEFAANGHPETSWEDWQAARHAQLPTF